MQPRNPWLCVSIVAFLGSGLLVGVGGIVACSLTGRDPHTSLSHIAIGCFGALASFLVAVPRGSVGYGADGKSKPPSP